jgi:aspartate aminotransferase, mitochondrial
MLLVLLSFQNHHDSSSHGFLLSTFSVSSPPTATLSSLSPWVLAAAAAASSETVTNVWHQVPAGPVDAILGIAADYRACTTPHKVNLCVGAYRNDDGLPYLLPSVQQAEQIMRETKEDKEYLPIEGDTVFIEKALQFAYGSELLKNVQVAGVQTLSGTGACRVGGHFIQQFWPSGSTPPTVFIPVPTWTNHWKIFKECGLNTAPYRYYNYDTNTLDLEGLLTDIQNAPDQSVILLHACAHNPTGCDPTHEQWERIADIIAQKKHLVFFDSAYQGFASGNSEHDAWSLRHFCSRGNIPVLLAQSFAKNFGLYGERCGTFSVVCASSEQRSNILSQLRNIIRPMYSSPPKHGSSIVRTVLSDAELTAQYYEECAGMSHRIQEMRAKLVDKLREVGSQHDWSHIASQIGMFAYTGMSKVSCLECISQLMFLLRLAL